MKSQESPAFLYQEPDLIGLTARDFTTDDVDRVQVDKKDDFDRLMEIIKKIDAKSNTKKKITHFDEEIPIFERFNVVETDRTNFYAKSSSSFRWGDSHGRNRGISINRC